MREVLGKMAQFVTVGLTGVLAFRRIDDFDTWWHLAAGRWIVGHRLVPTTDFLSHTVRGHPWVNLEWAYEVIIFLLDSEGGPALLSVAAACGFTLAVWLLSRLVRPHLGDVGGAFLTLAVVLVLQDRFTVRPEMVSFPLLVGLLSILESAQNRGGRGLWLLVPLMVVWVNVHALFVIGVFAILCALAGAPSRKLAIWGFASIAAVLLNPFGLDGALLPAKLFTLIDKSSPVFQTIAEFRSPFASDAIGLGYATYKVLLFAGTVSVLAALGLSFRERRVSDRAALRAELSRIAFFAGLALLSVIARRNTALFALGASPLIARSLGTIASRLPETMRASLRRIAPACAAASIVLAMLLASSVVTGAFYRWDRQPREFGAGVLEGSFPIRAVAFAREARLPGKLYNDVAAGGYLAWDDPIGDGVFIDGRLEVYDTPFFSDYVASMYDPERFEATADRYGIQTVILFHRWENRRLLIERLVQGGLWSLVYADEVAAVFVRAQGNDEALARAASMNDRWNRQTRAWLARPIPKWRYPAGRVEGTRSFARLLATIGDPESAADVYSNLLQLHVATDEEIDVRLLLARRFAATGRSELAREQAKSILAIAPSNLEAQRLLQ
jgi:hypothetical protein